MAEQPNSTSEYAPVHRISLACTSCRRKKARCTGDRPTCASCRRLRIECFYPTDTTKIPTVNTTEDTNVTKTCQTTVPALISAKLSSIDLTLQEFGSQLRRIRSDLDSLTSRQARFNPEEYEAPELRAKRRRTGSEDLTNNLQHPNSRHNPPVPEETLLPREVILATIDAYFTYCHNQPYCFFHEATFRLRFAQGSIPKHLIAAVLATAIRFTKHPCLDMCDPEVAAGYANRSWKSVVANCFTTNQRPDVTLVQTLSLLGLFDFTAGKSRHAAAWVKTGLAVRIAQELGLMHDAPSDLPFYDQEERRRTFWSAYLLDRLNSCGRGRPLAVLDASCNLQLPCTDWAWKDGSLEATPTLDDIIDRSSGRHHALSPFARAVAAASLLGRSIQYSLQQINIRGRCPPWDPSSDFAALESDFLHLEAIYELQLPVGELLQSYTTSENTIDQPGVSPLILSRIIFHLCHCLHNHPFLLRQRVASGDAVPPTSFLARAFGTSWQHASQMVDLVSSARKHGYVFTASFSGYCVLVAGSIIALHQRSGDSSISDQAGALLQEVFVHLESLGKYWDNVLNMIPALRLVIERSAALCQLPNPQARVLDLESTDSELMWTVVDYGNISNKASTDFAQEKGPGTDLWFECFYDLFGSTSGQDALENLGSTIDPFGMMPS